MTAFYVALHSTFCTNSTSKSRVKFSKNFWRCVKTWIMVLRFDQFNETLLSLFLHIHIEYRNHFYYEEEDLTNEAILRQGESEHWKHECLMLCFIQWSMTYDLSRCPNLFIEFGWNLVLKWDGIWTRHNICLNSMKQAVVWYYWIQVGESLWNEFYLEHVKLFKCWYSLICQSRDVRLHNVEHPFAI